MFLISYCVVKHWKGNWDDVLVLILDLATELIYLAFIFNWICSHCWIWNQWDWYKGAYFTWCCYPRPLAIVIATHVIATHWNPNSRYFHLSSVNSLFLLNFICIKIQKKSKNCLSPLFLYHFCTHFTHLTSLHSSSIPYQTINPSGRP